MAPSELDGSDAAPWYAKLVLRGGFQIFIASALLWFVLHDVSTYMKSNADVLAQLVANNLVIAQNQRLIIDHEGSLLDILREHALASSLSNIYLICISRAHTEGERQQCSVMLTSHPVTLPMVPK